MKTVLITGANRGIGLETARQYGKENFRVILSGRDQEQLEKAQKQLKKEKYTVDLLLMDVREKDSIREAAAQLKKSKTSIDVLINNAGVLLKQDQRLLADDDEILRAIVEINSYGPLLVSKYFLPLMVVPGRIIMVSSTGGSMSEPVGGWSPAYCASKTLLNAITRQLAHELEEKNITVNAVHPGWVKTEMGGKNAPRTVEQGAATQLWLGTEASPKLTGKFFMDKKEIAW